MKKIISIVLMFISVNSFSIVLCDGEELNCERKLVVIEDTIEECEKSMEEIEARLKAQSKTVIKEVGCKKVYAKRPNPETYAEVLHF